MCAKRKKNFSLLSARSIKMVDSVIISSAFFERQPSELHKIYLLFAIFF